MNINSNVPFRNNMGKNDFLVFLFLKASRDPECLRLFIRYWKNKETNHLALLKLNVYPGPLSET